LHYAIYASEKSTLHNYDEGEEVKAAQHKVAKANLNSKLKFRLIKLSASEFISCHDLRLLCVLVFAM
jgi:hypothetical protein